MKSFLVPTLCVAAWCAFASSASALNLSLSREIPPGSDGSIDRTFILNGASKIYLRLPSEWRWTGTPQSLTLTPGQALAVVRLEQVNAAQPIVLDEASLAALRKQAAESLPEMATGIKTVSEDKNLFLRAGWKSWETVVAYTAYGTTMQQATLILNIDNGLMLRLRVVTRKEDFAKVHAQALNMLSTWFEPNKDLPPSIAQEYGKKPDGA